jgi:signal transduction histidine kinase
MRAGAGVQRPSGTGDQRPAHAGRSQRGLTQRGPVDLAAIVGDVLGALQPDLQAPQLRVSASVGAAPALGDPSLTERMVVNLLGNAITHNVPGGWIDVITGVRDGRAWLTVANTGPAIPPAQVSQLFEPFRRLRTDRTGGHDGLGLGLSIVQAIASAHDADLEAQARPGGGLVIWVSFPDIRPA